MTVQPNKCANGTEGYHFPWVTHLLLVVMDPGHARVSLLSDGVQTHIPGRLNLAPS